MFVSDMSYGALSEEAKVALSRGAELAGTGICSGEGGMLPEEQAENSRYFYELASGSVRMGPRPSPPRQRAPMVGPVGPAGLPLQVRPGGQDRDRRPPPRHKVDGQDRRGPRAGGGHRRDLAVHGSPTWDTTRTTTVRPWPTRSARPPVGSRSGPSCRPSTSRTTSTPRSRSGVDYIILDGRGGGTGAAPVLFRDHISVPTIPALARARRHLDGSGVVATCHARSSPAACGPTRTS